MATWTKIQRPTEDGRIVSMQAPVIVSASRSTDIPAFYSDWFFHRLQKGYSAWTNPFNGVKSYVSYENTRFIVFWSKNPRPLLPYLQILKDRNIKCYVQYSLNDYEQERLINHHNNHKKRKTMPKGSPVSRRTVSRNGNGSRVLLPSHF